MENFKEIAEKCLAGELSGTFVTAFDNNWHSSYLQRYAILGHEMPEQYVLGPGIIYNDRGQCTSNEKVKIVDFIPDTMRNFKEIAEKCLAGELSGVFVFQNGQTIASNKLRKFSNESMHDDYIYYFDKVCTLDHHGFGYNSSYNIINFIRDNMQKKIEIDIPEGKVPVMEQTENGVVITWKEKEITYADVISKLVLNQNAIYEFWSDKIHKGESSTFYKKVDVLRKLINIRNYFGGDKPTNSWIITIDSALRPFVIKNPKPYRETCFIYFDTQEHAEQAIKMLGDELQYLFKPW